MEKLLNYLLNLISSKCSDCGVKMRRNDKIIMASCNGWTYYRGKGICGSCNDKRLKFSQET